MFGTLKSFGDKLADGVREFENNLAQPLVQQPRQPSPRPSRPSISTGSPRGSQDARDSLDSNRAPDSPSSASSSKPRQPQSPLNSDTSGQSASQLADSAISSLRASLRKQRPSLDAAKTQGVDAIKKSTELLLGSKKAEPPVAEEHVHVPKTDASPTDGRIHVEPSAPVAELVSIPSAEVKDPEKEGLDKKEELVVEAPKGESTEDEEKLEVEEAPLPPPTVPNTTVPEIPSILEPAIEEAKIEEATPTAEPTTTDPPQSALPESLFSIATAEPNPDTSRAITPHPTPASPKEESVDIPITDSIVPPPPLSSDPESTLEPAPSAPKPEILSSATTAPEESISELPAIPPPESLIPKAVTEIKAEEDPTTAEDASKPVEAEAPPPVRPTHSRTSSRAATPEITQAYKRLQTLKLSLDKIVGDVLGLSGVSDIEAFEGELQNLKGKASMSMAEVGRLTSQLSVQKDRMEEVRDTHRLEAKSQSEQIELLQAQLKTAQEQSGKSQAEAAAAKVELSKAHEEQEKLKLVAKEEEEKRVKALSLLRALRLKLTKAEKEKEDVEKERDSMKSSDASAQDMIKADRQKFDQEIISLRAAQEQQITKLRQSFDRETNSIRAQAEREAAARKSQFELDVITTKSLHSKELATKDSRVKQLEDTVRELTAGRDSIFDQLQMRTAEMESSTAHQESLQGQTGELQYELKETKDRIAALQEELEEARKAKRDVSRDDANTRRLIAEAEARHEAKVRDLEARAKQLEKDRQETEEEMGRNLQDRLKEVERMRQQIAQKDIDYAESVHSAQQRDAMIEEGENQKKELRAKVDTLEEMLSELREDAQKSVKTEAAVREELSDRMQRASELEQRLEEVQAKESSLRSNNKTLREELRKLQSGILLSEKQRNPGVGYFASYSHSTPINSVPRSPTMSDGTDTPRSRAGSVAPTPGSENGNGAGKDGNGEEALNFEYIRNVILQFLERPEMRPHLIGVLGVILHFTPAESRRLTAKAGKA